MNEQTLPLRYTQNFLKSTRLVDKIVSLAAIDPAATVLEVGPGKGIITHALAQRVGENGRVIAVELDAQLAAGLRHTCQPFPQIEIVQADILRFDVGQITRPYYLFSNIPFSITAPLLTHLLTPTTGPQQAHLILQRDTLIASSKWGDNDTFKAMLIRPLYDIALVHAFARSDFAPSPGVETALFAFTRRNRPLVSPADYALYQDFMAFVSKDRVGEGAWRKLFSKKQIAMLGKQSALVVGRGLKSQSAVAMIAAFDTFITHNRPRIPMIAGALQALRKEQQRKEKIDRRGGHRRRR